MITHQILLRGAAQCYLLQTAMRLVDVVSVPVHSDLQVPVHMSPDCAHKSSACAHKSSLCTRVQPVVVLSKGLLTVLSLGVQMEL